MIRWMEALVERTDSPGRPATQSPWTADAERRPDVPPIPMELPHRARTVRALNFVLALLAVLALLPVFVLLAVLVRLTSRGPVFYLQERVGLDRRLPGPGA
ncbi:MAG TPA: sugar transferase, partial [Gemmatimonadales bacterium]|nr:sugar transferase [Gemmatimonadales bacterium]